MKEAQTQLIYYRNGKSVCWQCADSIQHVKVDNFDEGHLLTVKIRPDEILSHAKSNPGPLAVM